MRSTPQTGPRTGRQCAAPAEELFGEPDTTGGEDRWPRGTVEAVEHQVLAPAARIVFQAVEPDFHTRTGMTAADLRVGWPQREQMLARGEPAQADRRGPDAVWRTGWPQKGLRMISGFCAAVLGVLRSGSTLADRWHG
ncbi:hypothetical protein [Rhodococcus koreensis]